MKKLFVCFLALIVWSTGHTHDMGESMKKVLPSITYIRAQQFQLLKEINPVTKEITERSIEVTPIIGTGFVIKGNIVVTNYHVVAPAITSGTDILVSFIENNTRHKAAVVGYDKTADVALLRINGKFPSVKIDDCACSYMGQEVFTISHFYGIGWSATNGIISSTERGDPRYPYIKNLQLQILSGSGSSGGAVFNTEGEVVGLNRSIISMAQSAAGTTPRSQLSMVAFPIRGDSLVYSIDRIQKEHLVIHVDLGVHLAAFGIDNTTYSDDNESSNRFIGILVFSVVEESFTTLKSGDLIVSVDNQTFTEPDELLNYLDNKYNVGDVVKFYVYRNGIVINIDVTLESAGE